MSTGTGIEWTDATWNPTVGCSILSPGCTNCYAMKLAHRFGGSLPWSPAGKNAKYAGLTKAVNYNAVWTGKVRLDESALAAPLKWRKPRRIFVNSMSDLFHEALTDEQIDRVFAVMALAERHTFQVLTKRADRMRRYMSDPETPKRILAQLTPLTAPRPRVPLLDTVHAATVAVVNIARWPLPNVWLGVSVEDQKRADERIPDLLATPARVHFLSCEPLLGPVNIERWTDMTVNGRYHASPIIGWVIAGGESGGGARPSHPSWFRSLRDQCAAAGIPFFFKQRGDWTWGFNDAPTQASVAEDGRGAVDRITPEMIDGSSGTTWFLVGRVGKKAAGALLDGREHREFPT